MASITAEDPVTFTCVPQARRETVDFLARLSHLRRCSNGTRSGTRAMGPFKHAVLAPRSFLDNTRIRQSPADNAIGTSTAYDYLHEAIDVLAALAPCVHDALPAAGATHLNLDGTPIHTDRVAIRGPNGANLWWSGKHKHHGGNIQVLSYPDGFPCRASDVRPGREHDTTCAKKPQALLPALEFYEAEYRIPTLTDPGYVSLSPHRIPVKTATLTMSASCTGSRSRAVNRTEVHGYAHADRPRLAVAALAALPDPCRRRRSDQSFDGAFR